MNPNAASGRTTCNCLAQQRGLDPVGHAGGFEDAVVIEAPLPWPRDLTQPTRALPEPVSDLLGLWMARYRAGGGYPHYLLLVAPDPEYSREGYRRVMFYTRPAGLFARYEQVEYVVPVAVVGALVWAWYEDRGRLPDFEPYRVRDAGPRRDVLVCTHGSVDAACGKFGYPLYRTLRDNCANERLRVWRVSHFGGHVFAPTLLDMPTGHCWAYVQTEQAAQIARREGDVGALRGHYRGWAGLGAGFLQAAECELWQQYGWEWFDYVKSGEVVAQDAGEKPAWAEVRIHYHAPGASSQTTMARMRVEVNRYVETEPSTGQAAVYAYPQYGPVTFCT
ncbi:MAG: sucrase ferredoxin [Anaerolineae bacterium]|nr:sucrase ferredoxin [Anaerolineae bacterium]